MVITFGILLIFAIVFLTIQMIKMKALLNDYLDVIAYEMRRLEKEIEENFMAGQSTIRWN